MTICLHCEELEAEVYRLKRELGDVVDLTQTDIVRRRFRILPMEARLLMRLYEAKGRVVANGTIEDDVLGRMDGSNTIKVHVSRLRSALGKEAIENVPGVGYRLSALGRARVYQTIHPREIFA